MYLQNKYTIWYFSIINHARQMDYIGYTEKHHIIPKSLGGGDSFENIVSLTARQHFICHLLLPKMVTGYHYHKMIYALNMMLCSNKLHNRYKISSRAYEYLKKEFSKTHSIIMTGFQHTEESKKKIGDASRGKKKPPFSNTHKENISKAKKGQPNINRRGISGTLKGKTYEEIMGHKKATLLKEKRRITMKTRVILEKTIEKQRQTRKNMYTGGKNNNAIPITVNGINFICKKDACDFLNITLYKLNRIDTGHYNE